MDNLFSLEGKNAVVVGGGGGIGRGLAQGLVQYGAQVGIATSTRPPRDRRRRHPGGHRS